MLVHNKMSGIKSELCLHFLAILLNIVFIFRVILCIPFHGWKFILTLIVKYFRPEFGSIVSENKFLRPDGSFNSAHNFLLTLCVNGIVNIEELQDRFVQNCISARARSAGEKLMFPELTQSIKLISGYPFWVEEKNFQLNDHVFWEEEDLGGQGSDDEAIAMVFEKEQKLLSLEFERGKSPWRVNIGIDKRSRLSTLRFIFHHSLGDGVSVYNALIRCVDNPFPIQTLNIPNSKSKWSKYNFYPKRMIQDYLDCDFGPPLTVPREKMSVKRQFVKSRSIPTAKFKRIGQEHGLPFTGVILCALTGALRKYLIEKRVEPPSFIFCPVTTRPSSQKDGLTNAMKAVGLKLPTGLNELEKRMEFCGQNLRDAIDSKFPHYSTFDAWIKNAYPLSWGHGRMARIPMVLSSMPGPRSPMTLCGGQSQVTDMYFTTTAQGHLGMAVSTLTYNSSIRILISADANIFVTLDNAQKFMNSLELEIELMSKL